MTIREFLAGLRSALQDQFPDVDRDMTMADYGLMAMTFQEFGAQHVDELPRPSDAEADS